MRKTIFISCGQYSDAEKRLGKQIAEMVRALTDCEPFFAEEVHDLNGLDTNILTALRECAAFITVLHPRGQIRRPDGPPLVRASVWIEQEIAVATYIQRSENRALPIIAFKHRDVGLEGIRSLLNLNPIEFDNESEVLAELPKRIRSWGVLKASGIDLQLTSIALRQQDDHSISFAQTKLVNDTNYIIERYVLEVRMPSDLLRHWNAQYAGEVKSDDRWMRRFRFDEKVYGVVGPREHRPLAGFEYCTKCAAESAVARLEIPSSVSGLKIRGMIWIDGKEFEVEKSTQQLAMER